MTDRERLINLLEQEKAFSRYITDDERREQLADYLLENGVIVLPCKVGDTVYKFCPYCIICARLHTDPKFCGELKECGTLGIEEIEFEYNHIPEIGKTIFTTRAEAEKALKERGQE